MQHVEKVIISVTRWYFMSTEKKLPNKYLFFDSLFQVFLFFLRSVLPLATIYFFFLLKCNTDMVQESVPCSLLTWKCILSEIFERETLYAIFLLIHIWWPLTHRSKVELLSQKSSHFSKPQKANQENFGFLQHCWLPIVRIKGSFIVTRTAI